MTELMTDLAVPVKPPRGKWRDVWDQFKSHKGALAGMFIFAVIVLGVILGPLPVVL